MTKRRPYPSDVTDEEWTFAVPYLTPMDPQARQRKYDPHMMFNALRWIVRAEAPWRLMPHEFPPWEAVYQQAQRWLQAGCFEAMVCVPALGAAPGAGQAGPAEYGDS